MWFRINKSEEGTRGISAFIVEKGMEGFTYGIIMTNWEFDLLPQQN